MNIRLKCLILDDEHLIRELLKRTVDWERHRLDLIAEAESAMEAIELIEEDLPDLLIVDICIPFMNGIEFSRHILRKYPQIKIIILTGHDDFDYARQSLKIGIADFLLKPINPEEINATLEKICTVIRDNKRQLKEYDYIRKQLEENKNYLRERFLINLVKGNLSSDEINEKLDYYGISFSSDMFQAALIELSPMNNTKSEEEALLLQFQSIEYISRFFDQGKEIRVFRGDKERIVLINNNQNLFTTDYYEAIRENLTRSFNCSVTFGVGCGKKGISALPASYKEAVTAMDFKLIEGKNTVISFSDITPPMHDDYGDMLAGLDNFSFYLNAGISEKAVAEIVRLLEGYCPLAINDIVKFQIPAVNILSRIVNTLCEQEPGLTLLGRSMMELYNRLLVIDTLPEMSSYLSQLAKDVTAGINNFNSQKTGKLICEVKTFLKEHFGDCELNLNQTADCFNVNSSYLSRKFKEETGQSFIDYLSKLRLTKAVSLLQETDNRNYEISEMVGIADPHYFSIFFKKHMKMSISEYRQKIDH